MVVEIVLYLIGIILIFIILKNCLFSASLNEEIIKKFQQSLNDSGTLNLNNLKKDSENEEYDLVIRHGKVFDGTGLTTAKNNCDVAIKNGKIVLINQDIQGKGIKEVDAKELWVCPGFIDIHCHYDVEIEKFPGLEESVRHGVTSIMIGNCSLSAALTDSEEDLLDLFCRVENMPKEIIKDWLQGKITWRTVTEYYDHLEKLPIGPNIATLLGHSNLRAHVMGLSRSLNEDATKKDIDEMKEILKQALEIGYFGLSIDLLPFHKMTGTRFEGIPIPSQRASFGEYMQLASVVRKFGALLQATPNALHIHTVAFLLFLSTSFLSKRLKTTILASLDVKVCRYAPMLISVVTRITNLILGGNVRFQALSVPFLVFSDGPTSPLFEEFRSGYELMNVNEATKKEKCKNLEFRKNFKRDWYAWGQRLFHRNMDDMWIVSCPKHEEYVGKSFGEIAKGIGVDPVDLFLDLVAELGDGCRWKTVVANDRPEKLRKFLSDEAVIIGFSDSGAHTQNMANHHSHLHVLYHSFTTPNWISNEKAVSIVTGIPATWLELPDVGLLLTGRTADITIIDPNLLNSDILLNNEPMFVERGGANILVRRTDGIVKKVFINGKLAFDSNTEEKFSPSFGKEKFGRLLKRKL